MKSNWIWCFDAACLLNPYSTCEAGLYKLYKTMLISALYAFVHFLQLSTTLTLPILFSALRAKKHTNMMLDSYRWRVYWHPRFKWYFSYKIKKLIFNYFPPNHCWEIKFSSLGCNGLVLYSKLSVICILTLRFTVTH